MDDLFLFGVMAVCVFGAGLSSYYIGKTEGVILGSSALYDMLVSQGKYNPDNELTVLVELEKPQPDRTSA